MGRIVAVAVLASGLLFGVGAPPSFACSCGGEGTFAEEVAASDAVFVGTTLAIKENWFQPGPNMDVTHMSSSVTMEVLRVHRGNFGPKVIVRTGPNEAMCGYTFIPGRTEVVFGHWREGELAVDLCSLTIPFAGLSPEDLDALGPGRAPVQVDVPDDPEDPLETEAGEAVPAAQAEGEVAGGWLTPAVGWGVLAGLVIGAAGAAAVLRGRRSVE